jgi:hypothetical protein
MTLLLYNYLSLSWGWICSRHGGVWVIAVQFIPKANTRSATIDGVRTHGLTVQWLGVTLSLCFAFIHNFDVVMLSDIRQFVLTEAVV